MPEIFIGNIKGPRGDQGLQGAQGIPGNAATVKVNSVTTLAPGSAARVENVGTANAALLDFAIPSGFQGLPGSTWGGVGGNIEDQADLMDALDEKLDKNLPWCLGRFNDTSIAAAGIVTLTPLYDSGDSSMLDGNKFIAGEDGLYLFQAVGGHLGSSRRIINSISHNESPAASGRRLADITSFSPAPLNAVLFMNNGDYLQYGIFTPTAASTINSSNTPTWFAFMRIR